MTKYKLQCNTPLFRFEVTPVQVAPAIPLRTGRRPVMSAARLGLQMCEPLYLYAGSTKVSACVDSGGTVEAPVHETHAFQRKFVDGGRAHIRAPVAADVTCMGVN